MDDDDRWIQQYEKEDAGYHSKIWKVLAFVGIFCIVILSYLVIDDLNYYFNGEAVIVEAKDGKVVLTDEEGRYHFIDTAGQFIKKDQNSTVKVYVMNGDPDDAKCMTNPWFYIISYVIFLSLAIISIRAIVKIYASERQMLT